MRSINSRNSNAKTSTYSSPKNAPTLYRDQSSQVALEILNASSSTELKQGYEIAVEFQNLSLLDTDHFMPHPSDYVSGSDDYTLAERIAAESVEENKQVAFFSYLDIVHQQKNQNIVKQLLDYFKLHNASSTLSKEEQQYCQEAFALTTYPQFYLGEMGVDEKQLASEAKTYCNTLYNLVRQLSKNPEISPYDINGLLKSYHRYEAQFLKSFKKYQQKHQKNRKNHLIRLYGQLKEILLFHPLNSEQRLSLTRCEGILKGNIQRLGGSQELSYALNNKESSLALQIRKKYEQEFSRHESLLNKKVVLTSSIPHDLAQLLKQKPLSCAMLHQFLNFSYYYLGLSNPLYRGRQNLIPLENREVEESVARQELQALIEAIKSEIPKKEREVAPPAPDSSLYDLAKQSKDLLFRLETRIVQEEGRKFLPGLLDKQIQSEKQNFQSRFSLSQLPQFESWFQQQSFSEEEFQFLAA